MYQILMYAHLATVIPCVFIGAYLFIVTKGTSTHRLMGKIYMLLMTVTAVITLFMPAQLGAQFLNHFGWIHLFSILALYSAPTALIAIRKGQIKKHQIKMVLLYIGAIMIAGGFTFVPGRFMHEVFFS